MEGGVEGATLAEQTAARLQQEIYSGAYPVGDRLPSERALSLELGVNRSVIREALTHLGRLGLVETRRGSGTRVTDFRTSGTLEMLEGLVASGPVEFSRALVLDVLDFRLGYGPGLAELAARNANSGDVVRLGQAATRLNAARGELAWIAAEADYIAELVACTHNRIYQLIHGTLARSFKSNRGFAALLFLNKQAVEGAYAAVAHAVATESPGASADHMRALMEAERVWVRSVSSP